MRAIQSFVFWLSLVATVASGEQVPIIGKTTKRYNITLGFDDLPTNGSGIGFHPSSPSNASFSYKGFFLESFTVKNVAKALPDLDSPVDIMCASSAPNALFTKRILGYPWPHISLPDLALPPDHPRANVTFNMNSVMLSPTGIITGDIQKTIAQVTLTMLKLPSNTPDTSLPPGKWPGLLRGDPGFPVGAHVFQIGVIFRAGTSESIKLDFERYRDFIPGFGEGVDVLEMYAEVYRVNEKKLRWELDRDWEFCLDDVAVEVVEGGADVNSPGGERNIRRLTFQHLWDDVMIDGTDLGDEVLQDLGRLSDDGFRLDTGIRED